MGLTEFMKKLFEEEEVQQDQAQEIEEMLEEELLEDEDGFIINNEEKGFLLKIEDIFALKDKGCVIAGKVLRGCIESGEVVSYVDEKMRELFECGIQAIEQNHYKVGKASESGNYGAHYGFLILDHNKEEFEVGNYLAVSPASR